jgi:HAE1 family hydrophobic/amphiphilic exporter-1
MPIITFAVAAPEMSDTELSYFIDDVVTKALLGVKGVSRINRVGGVERQINVTIFPERLNAYGLTAPQVNNALRSFVVDAPGGRAEVGGREQTVRVLGSAATVQTLRDLTIRRPPVSTFGCRTWPRSATARPRRGASRGSTAGPWWASRSCAPKGSSDVGVEDGVYEAVDELRAAHPDVTFTKLVSAVDEVRADFEATVHVLLEGMFLAVLVVFFFLRDWRSTLITALAMPLSLIPTFFVMQLMGFSLNVVTLLALTLVIGILVDDAIVEIENIQKRVETGVSPYDASMEGADSIGLAVVATTFAIVAVFMPWVHAGVAGQFFREFGITVSIAVLFSLVVARLVTPLMTPTS